MFDTHPSAVCLLTLCLIKIWLQKKKKKKRFGEVGNLR